MGLGASDEAMGASEFSATADSSGGSSAREFYLLRRYDLPMGPQTAVAERYLGEALIPALRRRGLGPVGALKLEIGPETPAYYVLIPGPDAAALATLDVALAGDTAFLKAAEPFWGAPASSPAFRRVESTLLLAFEGWPKLVLPGATPGLAAAPTGGKSSAAVAAADNRKRVYQLRTYESPSHAAHVRKVEMFHHGEFAIFQRTGLHPVFFGQTLVGGGMPSLTYLLSFADTREMEANWAAFSADPEWKKLSTDPHYAYEPIVSKITNLILSPLAAPEV